MCFRKTEVGGFFGVGLAVSGWLVFSAACIPAAGAAAEDAHAARWQSARDAMVDNQLIPRDIKDSRVLEIMRQVPRHLFVPDRIRMQAYEDRPLPIGSGQTISQPYIVALMTELSEVEPSDRVLEIGTGSGYQAAVLSLLAAEVYSIELLPELAESADRLLKELEYPVEVRAGDGYLGWPEAAPFDAILVTAAAPRIPEPLVEQLAEGGVLVIPVGERFQELMVMRKEGGELRRRSVIPVRFVPMLGQVRE